MCEHSCPCIFYWMICSVQSLNSKPFASLQNFSNPKQPRKNSFFLLPFFSSLSAQVPQAAHLFFFSPPAQHTASAQLALRLSSAQLAGAAQPRPPFPSPTGGIHLSSSSPFLSRRAERPPDESPSGTLAPRLPSLFRKPRTPSLYKPPSSTSVAPTSPSPRPSPSSRNAAAICRRRRKPLRANAASPSFPSTLRAPHRGKELI